MFRLAVDAREPGTVLAGERNGEGEGASRAENAARVHLATVSLDENNA